MFPYQFNPQGTANYPVYKRFSIKLNPNFPICKAVCLADI